MVNDSKNNGPFLGNNSNHSKVPFIFKDIFEAEFAQETFVEDKKTNVKNIEGDFLLPPLLRNLLEQELFPDQGKKKMPEDDALAVYNAFSCDLEKHLQKLEKNFVSSLQKLSPSSDIKEKVISEDEQKPKKEFVSPSREVDVFSDSGLDDVPVLDEAFIDDQLSSDIENLVEAQIFVDDLKPNSEGSLSVLSADFEKQNNSYQADFKQKTEEQDQSFATEDLNFSKALNFDSVIEDLVNDQALDNIEQAVEAQILSQREQRQKEEQSQSLKAEALSLPEKEDTEFASLSLDAILENVIEEAALTAKKNHEKLAQQELEQEREKFLNHFDLLEPSLKDVKSLSKALEKEAEFKNLTDNASAYEKEFDKNIATKSQKEPSDHATFLNDLLVQTIEESAAENVALKKKLR